MTLDTTRLNKQVNALNQAIPNLKYAGCEPTQAILRELQDQLKQEIKSNDDKFTYCKDNLPTEKGLYLVAYKNDMGLKRLSTAHWFYGGNTIMVDESNEGAWYWNVSDFLHSIKADNIYAWKELPKPPEFPE